MIVKHSHFRGVGGLTSAVLVLMIWFLSGCQEDLPSGPSFEMESSHVSSTLLSETITISPEGTRVAVLNEMASLSFPAGAVSDPMTILVSSFCTEEIVSPDFKCQGCGLRLENESGQRYFNKPYTIEIRYCLTSPDQASLEGQAVQLYQMNNQGLHEKDFRKMENCCVDCCKKVIIVHLNDAVVSLVVGTE